jgi:outer membrane protein TolC
VNKIILILSISVLVNTVFAQNMNSNAVDFEKIVPTGETKPTNFEDFLVSLAWKNNPSNDVLSYKVEFEKQEKSIAKKEWTRNLSLATNLNESNYPYFLVNYLKIDSIGGRAIDQKKIPSVVTYPLWNLGVGINFGDLFVRKHKMKAADQKIKIAEAEINQQKLKIRAETLARYQKYVSSFEVLKVRIQSLTTAEANKVFIADLWSENKVKFEDSNEANKTYYEASEAKVNAELELKLAKINVEEIVGIKWEVLERYKATFKN